MIEAEPMSGTEKVEIPINYQSFDGMVMTLNTPYNVVYQVIGVDDNGEFLNIKYKLGDRDVSVTVKKEMITRENNGFRITSPTPFVETGTTGLLIAPKS